MRAEVKRAHIRALKARLRRKKVPRIRNSMNLLSAERWRVVDMAADHEVVRWVVVSFAKTPLKAAQAPLATARASHGAL